MKYESTQIALLQYLDAQLEEVNESSRITRAALDVYGLSQAKLADLIKKRDRLEAKAAELQAMIDWAREARRSKA